MLRLAFDFIITWRETRTRPNAYSETTESKGRYRVINRTKQLVIQDVYA
jgi:hypothetical protein